MKSLRKKLLLMVVFIAVAVSGCATSPEPFDYGFDGGLPTGPGELKRGPGLFSGEDGFFAILGHPALPDEESTKQKEVF